MENLQDFFSNLDIKKVLAIGGFVLILASIPVAFTLVKNSTSLRSKASDQSDIQQMSLEELLKSSPATESKEVPANSPITDLKKLLETTSSATTPSSAVSPTPDTSLTFGPILSVKVAIEGRAENKQAAKVFVGIAAGASSAKPTYLLSYTIDIPDSGYFRGISLAGLNPGSVYTAYLKGPSQIDSAITFTMGPTETVLSNGQAIALTSGDLNEDNIIDATDYAIAKAAFGSNLKSLTWNLRADINADEVINNLDLGIILKNLGKKGVTGTWYSSAPTSTPSATPATGSPVGVGDAGGYWLWIPPTTN